MNATSLRARCIKHTTGAGTSLSTSDFSQSTGARRSGGSPLHPPFFGANYAAILAQSFDCHFSPVACEDDPPLPLSLYIEHVIHAAGLPFEVSIASLIILQRMYMHLMPEIIHRSADFSPHRLFVCAYVLAAKQHEHLRSNTNTTASGRTSAFSLIDLQNGTQEPNGAPPTSRRMSDTYWAQITGYTPEEIANMQHQLIHTLGRSVVVFQIHKRQEREYAEKLEGHPLMRGLPVDRHPTLPNLARMITEEQYSFFGNMGSISVFDPVQGAGQPSRVEVCKWWQSRDKLSV